MHTVMLENLEVNIGLHLGRGSTSTVWRGMHKGKDVVVKISHAELGGVTRSHEQKALETLARSLPHAFRNSVPRLCGVDARANALVMVPCGKFFALSTSQLGRGLLPHPQPEHFCALVDILQQVHQCARLVHRDLAPRNFYMDPTDEHVRSPPPPPHPGHIVLPCLQLILNDWGSAVPVGSKTVFQGAREYAANSVLQQWRNQEQITNAPTHDLVRAVAKQD